MRLNAIGIIAIAVLVLAGAAFGVAGGRRDTRTVHAVLRDAPEVRPGTRVTYVGVDIGVVQHVRLTNGGVAIDADIHRADVPLHAGDSVRVGVARTVDFDGLRVAVGSTTLEIVPGPAGSRAVGPLDTLAAAHPRNIATAPIVDPTRLRDSLARLVGRLRADSIEFERKLRTARPH